MRNTLLAGFFASIVLGAPAISGTFENGVAAYGSGDHVGAMQIWRALAETGDHDAQFNLGVMYAKGIGAPEDPDAALIWLIRSAEQGDLIAAYNLGRMYSRGPEAMQDLSTAAKWYHVAADRDHPAAMQDLAMLYATGRGVEQDISLAAQLTQKSQELECMVGDPAKNFNPRVKRMAVAN